MVASSTIISLGLRRIERRLVASGVTIGAVIPGVLALVVRRCVRGFVARTRGLVGLVVVVIGGAAAATLYWLGSFPSAVTLCGGCICISIDASDLELFFVGVALFSWAAP